MKGSTKRERMDEPFSFKQDDRSHQSCRPHELGGEPQDLKSLKEREFDNSRWLLERWHIAHNVGTPVCDEEQEHCRIMRAVWKSDSEAVLEALSHQPLSPEASSGILRCVWLHPWATATGSITCTTFLQRCAVR
jgi:hypothetical protein